MMTSTGKPAVDLGIVSFGYAFGMDTDVAQTAGEYTDHPEIVLNWGCHTYHRAEPEVHTTQLAAQAAAQAMSRGQVHADEVDLIVLASAEMPEFAYYDPTAGVARELGIERTQTLYLSEGCGAGTTGIGYVAGIMATQPDVHTAVFVAANRVSEYHRNRFNVNNSVHSDGAGAVVIRRGYPRLRWLATHQFSHPKYADWFRTDYGGAVMPQPPEGWSSRTGPGGNEKIVEFFGRNPRALREFRTVRNERVVEAVEGALAIVGLAKKDLTHTLYINDHPDNVRAISDPLGVPIERTNAEFTGPHGHMGAADQLISLGLMHDRGDVPTGSIVALCGISTGMRWQATILAA